MSTYVPGVGPKSPRLIIVGDFPDKQSNDTGIPFNGSKSSQLLDSMLESNEINRKDVYFTNLCKYQPLGDDVSSFYDFNSGLTAAGVEMQDELLSELEGIDCKAVLALGIPAVAALTGQHGSLGDWRGSPLEAVGDERDVGRPLADKVIIPSFHPTWIMKGQYLDRYLLKMDMAKAYSLGRKGWDGIPKFNLLTHPTVKSVESFLKKARKAKTTAFDIETGYDFIKCISFCYDGINSMAIPLDDGSYWNRDDRLLVGKLVRDFLENPGKTRLLGQNGNYDTFFGERYYSYDIDVAKMDDLMIAHGLIYPELRKRLSMLTSLYTYVPFYKFELRASRAAGNFQTELQYNAKDSLVTWLCWEQVNPMLDRDDLRPVYDRTMAKLPLAQEIQRQGFLIDKPGLKAIKVRYEAEIATLKAELQALTSARLKEYLRPDEEELSRLTVEREKRKTASKRITFLKKRQAAKKKPITDKESAELSDLLSRDLDTKPLTSMITKLRNRLTQWSNDQGEYELNPNTPDKCAEYFYDILKLPVYKTKGSKNKSGRSVDDKALAKMLRPTLYRPAVREAKIIQEMRGRIKIIGTYIDIEYDDDGRFRASINVGASGETGTGGTKFGRWSSDKLFFRIGHNQQNIPPLIRRAFLCDVPTKTKLPFFGEYDGKGAEWVVVAFQAPEPNMIKCIRDGIDPHTWTAHLMTGMSVAEVTEDKKLIGKERDADKIKLLRKKLKFVKNYDPKLFPRTGSLRQNTGKKNNHSLNYREGPYVYAEHNECTVSEAKRNIKLYTEVAYPGLKNWWADIENKLRSDPPNFRHLTNCFDRHIRFLGPVNGKKSSKTFKDATASIPQSTVFDLIVEAFQMVVENNHNVIPKSQNHDSFLLQHHIDLTQSLEHNTRRILSEMLECKDAIEQPMTIHGETFIIECDPTLGSNWAEQDPDNPDGLREVAFTPEAVEKFIKSLLKKHKKTLPTGGKRDRKESGKRLRSA